MPIRLFTLSLLLIAAVNTQAAYIGFSGKPTLVADFGSGLFAGTWINDTFAGSFSIPDMTDGPDTVEFDEADYEVTGVAGVGNGTTTVSATQLNINIQNNHALDQDEVDATTAILGPLPPGIGLNSIVDVWTVGALEAGAFFDADDDLANGHQFELALVDLDATVFDDLSYRSAPDLGQFELAVFSVMQADIDADPDFLAAGPASSLTTVPLPAALPLFASAIAGLGFLARRRLKPRVSVHAAIP